MSVKDLVLRLLFPPVCLLCGDREEKDGLCDACRKKYAAETFLRCPACSKTADRCLCDTEYARSSKTELDGKRFLALTWYRPLKKVEDGGERVTERMILKLKDRGDFADFFAGELARELSRLFEKAGEDPGTWTAAWCPRSAKRFIETGFDQSEEVARRTAKLLGCGARSLLGRVDRSEEQKSLGSREREDNARESIYVRRSKMRPGMKILLFDDIVTTGSTVSASADLLYEAGAAEVFPVFLARTIRRGPDGQE